MIHITKDYDTHTHTHTVILSRNPDTVQRGAKFRANFYHIFPRLQLMYRHRESTTTRARHIEKLADQQLRYSTGSPTRLGIFPRRIKSTSRYK